MLNLEITHQNKIYILEEDLPEVGCYIYVLDMNRNCLKDYLQINLNGAIDFCEKEFSIPPEKWNT